MKHVAKSTLIIGVFFALEKALGFVRQVIIARTFGLSAELDTFNAANNLPDLLFALISGGALAMALIPVLSEHLQKDGKSAAWDLFSRIGNLLFLATAGFSILIAVFAKQIVSAGWGIAPGFDQTQQALVAELMRLNLIATMLFSMSGLVIAGLQANQHFLLPALAPSMYDVGTLIGVLILVPDKGISLGGVTLPAFGLGVHGLVYGTILGAALFFAVQIPGLIHFKFKWTPKINLRNPSVQKVIRLMLPRIGTVFFIHIIFIAQDNLASGLIAGSVTALVYGWLFMQVPESLIGTAIGTALLPTISEQIARGETDAFKESLNATVRAILALTIPSTILLFIGARPLVGILGFDSAGTELVVWTVRAYMVGLVGHSLLEVAARAYYAQQKAVTPLLTSGATAAVFIILGLLLTPLLGAPGIGLANTLAFTGEAILLLWLVGRKFPAWLNIGKPLLRITLVSVGSGAIVYLLINFIPLDTLSTLMSTIVGVGIIGLGGLVVLPFIWPEVKLLGKI
ncbi:MAG: murein biosynthesis integral membrane protein MurJ [Anaerolineales bacterium]|nr:murein biosynthesis integral membrane protein MurJ [Chloroflexota bacterium]MBL6980287.1 murein biosynthesis integral membrane protein MurJ [Anaerolineales bacterium]